MKSKEFRQAPEFPVPAGTAECFPAFLGNITSAMKQSEGLQRFRIAEVITTATEANRVGVEQGGKRRYALPVSAELPAVFLRIAIILHEAMQSFCEAAKNLVDLLHAPARDNTFGKLHS